MGHNRQDLYMLHIGRLVTSRDARRYGERSDLPSDAIIARDIEAEKSASLLKFMDILPDIWLDVFSKSLLRSHPTGPTYACPLRRSDEVEVSLFFLQSSCEDPCYGRGPCERYAQIEVETEVWKSR
jgi:hypothetical protein